MDYVLLTDGGELKDYAEACQTADANKWELSMKLKLCLTSVGLLE